MRYKILDDLTSDTAFEAYGKTLEEVFQNAAEALFSIICQMGKVKARKKVVVSLEAKDLPDLMHRWLQELIALVDTEGMFFSRFKIISVKGNILKAEAWGEETRPELSGTLVKAVTYHKYKFEKSGKGYMVRCVLDI